MLIQHYKDAHNRNIIHPGHRGLGRKTKAIQALGNTYQTAASRITALQKETREAVDSLKAERESKNASLNALIDQRHREVSELDNMIKRYESLLLAQ